MSSAAAVAALTTQATTARPLLAAQPPVDAFAPTQADRPAAALPFWRERITAAANALAATQALTAGAALRAKALWSSRAWPAITACAAASLASIRERSSAAAQSWSGAWAGAIALAAQRAKACTKAMAAMQAPSSANARSQVRAWPWLTASVMLGVLAGVGWRALTPPVPALTPATSMTPAAPAVDIAKRPPISPPATARVIPAAVTLPPRPMPAVHTPSVVDDDDDEIEKPGTATPAPGESAPPGKRKLKVHRPRSPMSGDGVSPSPRGRARRSSKPIANPHGRASEGRRRATCARTAASSAPLMCMGQVCATAKWSAHAQCRNWHAMERRYMADSRP